MNDRVNSLLRLSGGTLTIPIEFSSLVISVLCAVISFLILKINVNFAYFFYVFTKSLADIDSDNLKTKDVGERFSFK